MDFRQTRRKLAPHTVRKVIPILLDRRDASYLFPPHPIAASKPYGCLQGGGEGPGSTIRGGLRVRNSSPLAAVILDKSDNHAVQVEEEHDQVERKLAKGLLGKQNLSALVQLLEENATTIAANAALQDPPSYGC